MKQYQVINEWVNTHLSTAGKASDISKDAITKLLDLYRKQDPIYTKRLHEISKSLNKNALQGVASLAFKNQVPNPKKPKDNLYSGMVLQSDPVTKIGTATLYVINPGFYNMRVVLRATPDMKVTECFIILHNTFEVDPKRRLLKQGNVGGKIAKEIFDYKKKADNGERVAAKYDDYKHSGDFIELDNGKKIPKLF